MADDEIDVFKFGMKGASLRWFIKKSTPRAPYYYWQHYTGGRKKGTRRERFLYAARCCRGRQREMTFRSHTALGHATRVIFCLPRLKNKRRDASTREVI